MARTFERNDPDIHTIAGKRKFIRDLTGDITNSMLEKVPKMPAEWDGHELRLYIRDKMGDGLFGGPEMSAVRKRKYKNEVLVRNL